MRNIFCDEPIIAAYRGSRKYEALDGANAFFDCYHDLAYHVTEGERIVLETEHFFISLDVHGVSKSEKTASIKEFERSGEWLDSFIHTLGDGAPPWVDYEATLFIGERLLYVESKPEYYLLRFDDFELKVVPDALHEEDFPCLQNKDHWSFNHVYGAERHLRRKCSCGGRGELLIDFVCDYVVRCKKCKKSTWAKMIAQKAIKEWNEGQIPCELSDITIE
jgi:hypothetical protein